MSYQDEARRIALKIRGHELNEYDSLRDWAKAEIDADAEEIIALVEAENRLQLESLSFSCLKCQRRSTYLEACMRNFNQYKCANCGGPLAVGIGYIELSLAALSHPVGQDGEGGA